MASQAADHASMSASCPASGDEEAASLLIHAAEDTLRPIPDTAAELAVAAFCLLTSDNATRQASGLRAIKVLIDAQHGSDAVKVADALLVEAGSDDEKAQIETQVTKALWDTGRIPELAARMQSLMTENISDSSRARLLGGLAWPRSGRSPPIPCSPGRRSPLSWPGATGIPPRLRAPSMLSPSCR
jgi:hypothetical protein